METQKLDDIFTEFFDSIGRIVLIFDPLGNVVYGNNTAIEELGLDKEAYPHMEQLFQCIRRRSFLFTTLRL